MQTQYHPHGMAGAINPHSSIYNNAKQTIKKKVSQKQTLALGGHQSPPEVRNGMIAALHPAGTIHVGG